MNKSMTRLQRFGKYLNTRLLCMWTHNVIMSSSIRISEFWTLKTGEILYGARGDGVFRGHTSDTFSQDEIRRPNCVTLTTTDWLFFSSPVIWCVRLISFTFFRIFLWAAIHICWYLTWNVCVCVCDTGLGSARHHQKRMTLHELVNRLCVRWICIWIHFSASLLIFWNWLNVFIATHSESENWMRCPPSPLFSRFHSDNDVQCICSRFLLECSTTSSKKNK